MDHSNERTPTLDELVVGIWRHKKLVLLCLAVSVALGGAWLLIKPKVYTATTVVRVEAQHLPEQFVEPTVTETVKDRLTTVRNEILSSAVLGQVIEDLDLVPDLRASEGMDAAVQAMRGRIDVKLEGESAFLVTASAGTPEKAAALANRLPEVYAAQAIRERADAAARAAAIFTAELDELRPQAEAYEERLTRFKAEHANALPETLEANLRQLDRLNGLGEMALTSLADAQRRRTAQARYGAESTVELGRLAALKNDARRELSSVQSVYTPDHPEVVAANRAYEAAKARFDSAAQAASHGDNEQARIDDEIEWLKGLTMGYQKRAGDVLDRIAKTPAVGAELAAINRDYEVLRAKYASLLSRKVEAELAQDLERRQKDSLFRVIEPALAPLSAAAPKPVSVLGIALLLGLGAGLAAAAWAASRDTSIRGVTDARQRLGLPVLAAVPSLEGRVRRGT